MNKSSVQRRPDWSRWVIRTDNLPKSVVRRRAACVVTGCTIMLAVAAWLHPSSSGMGTHTQLGLPPCSGVFGWPCPTCGMTTAFAHCIRGHWIDAWLAQPMGALLAVFVMAMLLLSVRELVTGRGWRINWYRVPPIRVVLVVVLLVLVAWIYKIVATGGKIG